MSNEQQAQTDNDRARALLTQWSQEWGCTVVSRYEGDRWDKLVELIAAALGAGRGQDCQTITELRERIVELHTEIEKWREERDKALEETKRYRAIMHTLTR
ncbi:snu13p [Caudoviricetes sp.]|nr:snu13p [Caudoviricetes sp.]UOF81337.1 snu13p [Caudoviricetes sp.]